MTPRNPEGPKSVVPTDAEGGSSLPMHIAGGCSLAEAANTVVTVGNSYYNAIRDRSHSLSQPRTVNYKTTVYSHYIADYPGSNSWSASHHSGIYADLVPVTTPTLQDVSCPD